MTQMTSPESAAEECTGQKQELLLAFHRVCWEEMTWRRNAGYRTVILGLGYCGLLLTVVAFNHQMSAAVRTCLSAVIALATVFGAGYLTSNYRKYMLAAAQMVKIEEYVGAYGGDFLGRLGALMSPERRARPQVPLSRDFVCLWSIIAFAAGGLVTAAAILLM
jgi:hypothetical protein